jgi:hypothetical protein
MASHAQVVANRSNAQRSTGPRTPEGKEKVSHNAVKHGLLARQAVVRGEDPEEFEAYRQAMLAEMVPAGAIEAMLAERIVGLSWRLRRAERLQNEAFDLLYLKEATDSYSDAVKLRKETGPDGYYAALGPVEQDLVAGQVIVRDFGSGRAFERLLMYERRIEQSLYRAMAELDKLQKARGPARPPAEPARPPGSGANADRLRQTNPISAERDAGRDAQTEPAARCAKQSQSPPAAREVLCEQGVMRADVDRTSAEANRIAPGEGVCSAFVGADPATPAALTESVDEAMVQSQANQS